MQKFVIEVLDKIAYYERSEGMANEQNLRPVKSKNEARIRGKAGGIRSGQVRKERKTLKETLLLMLSEGKTQDNITLALLSKAQKGDTKAYEVIRDTIGEKVADKLEQSGELNNIITIKTEGDVKEWSK